VIFNHIHLLSRRKKKFEADQESVSAMTHRFQIWIALFLGELVQRKA
jgi:hypothetical protein